MSVLRDRTKNTSGKIQTAAILIALMTSLSTFGLALHDRSQTSQELLKLHNDVQSLKNKKSPTTGRPAGRPKGFWV